VIIWAGKHWKGLMQKEAVELGGRPLSGHLATGETRELDGSQPQVPLLRARTLGGDGREGLGSDSSHTLSFAIPGQIPVFWL